MPLWEQIDNEDYTYYGPFAITKQIKAKTEAKQREVLYMKFIQTIPVVGAAGGIKTDLLF